MIPKSEMKELLDGMYGDKLYPKDMEGCNRGRDIMCIQTYLIKYYLTLFQFSISSQYHHIEIGVFITNEDYETIKNQIEELLLVRDKNRTYAEIDFPSEIQRFEFTHCEVFSELSDLDRKLIGKYLQPLKWLILPTEQKTGKEYEYMPKKPSDGLNWDMNKLAEMKNLEERFREFQPFFKTEDYLNHHILHCLYFSIARKHSYFKTDYIKQENLWKCYLHILNTPTQPEDNEENYVNLFDFVMDKLENENCSKQDLLLGTYYFFNIGAFNLFEQMGHYQTMKSKYDYECLWDYLIDKDNLFAYNGISIGVFRYFGKHWGNLLYDQIDKYVFSQGGRNELRKDIIAEHKKILTKFSKF